MTWYKIWTKFLFMTSSLQALKMSITNDQERTINVVTSEKSTLDLAVRSLPGIRSQRDDNNRTSPTGKVSNLSRVFFRTFGSTIRRCRIDIILDASTFMSLLSWMLRFCLVTWRSFPDCRCFCGIPYASPTTDRQRRNAKIILRVIHLIMCLLWSMLQDAQAGCRPAGYPVMTW